MRLGLSERTTIDCMLNYYATTLTGDEITRATTCAMLKEFFSYLDRKHCLTDNEREYIFSFDILSGIVGHKAFYDILDRWVTKTPVEKQI